MREKYSSAVVEAGVQCPQMKIQIKPLCWGLGIGWGSHKLALQVGPISVAIWFRMYSWGASKYYNKGKL